MSRCRSGYGVPPSLREIMYESGDIEEDESWRYSPVDYDNFYMIESYKYAKSFPKEWAQSHADGTGPEKCGNCYEHGSKDEMFVGYCLNCAVYVYKGKRGPGMNASLPVSESASEVEPIETKAERFQRIRRQFVECSRDLDFVFQLVEGKISEDDRRVEEFFGPDSD